ncbi:MAG: flagellar motor switch protein FliG [Spirochaetaceae bacterium]
MRNESYKKGSGKSPSHNNSETDTVRGLLKTGGSRKSVPGTPARAAGSGPAPAGGAAGGAVGAVGAEKAARFLMVLGVDEAAEVLRHLDEADVEAVTREIARIGTMTGREAEDILKQVGAATARAGERHGGPSVAKKFLSSAFGEERAAEVYAKLGIGESERFAFLEELEPQQVALLLKEESPPVVATILSTLSAAPAARVVKLMSEERRAEVVLRMARMNAVSPEVLARVEEVLKERIRRQGKLVSNEIDGRGVLASILRHMDLDGERAVLDSLAEEDPELARSIRDRLFTIDSILAIDDRDLQQVLTEFTEREIACVLTGQAERVRSKLLRNVSERRARDVSEEYVHQADIPQKEVSDVQRRFLDHLRRLAEEGSILVRNSDDEYI